MLNKKGFTLIETLFVLFIICMLSVLSLLFHKPSKTEKTVIKEIVSFLNEAKLTAMVSKETITVEFFNDSIVYSGDDKEEEYLLEENTYFENYKLTYNEYGNIKGAKTVTYHYFDHQYDFVYQVGSGSFYVQ